VFGVVEVFVGGLGAGVGEDGGLGDALVERVLLGSDGFGQLVQMW
jgi:hypothetical protein